MERESKIFISSYMTLLVYQYTTWHALRGSPFDSPETEMNKDMGKMSPDSSDRPDFEPRVWKRRLIGCIPRIEGYVAMSRERVELNLIAFVEPMSIDTDSKHCRHASEWEMLPAEWGFSIFAELRGNASRPLYNPGVKSRMEKRIGQLREESGIALLNTL